MYNNINELLDNNKKIVEKIIKTNRSYAPMVIMSVKGVVIPMIIYGGRENIKSVTKKVENSKNDLDWTIMMHEGYMETPRNESERLALEKDVNEKNYIPGSLEERYLKGDERIKWVFVLQAFFRKEKGENKESGDGLIHSFNKRMRVYSIQHKTLEFKLEQDTDEFKGYLALSL